VSGNWVASEG